MLVLSRKLKESIMIAADIEVRVMRLGGNRVVLGIGAPDHIPIWRQELHAEAVKQTGPGMSEGEHCQRYTCKGTIEVDDLGDPYCPRCGWTFSRDKPAA